jgi:UDP-N-acetylmuramate--alanine ligase
MTYPNRRIIVLFQPHTFSRTEAFKEDFAEVLQIADKAFILDVYASARETQTADSVGSQDIVDYAQNKGYEHVEYLDEEKVSYILREELHHGDVILTMGASNIFRLHNAIIEVITSKKTE